MSAIRCAKCKGVIKPNEECLMDDHGEDIHAVCPSLFGEPERAGYVVRRGLFDPLELGPDKGAT
ncbi:hypothetical protein PQR05_29825 [Paraburkholderia sediminicola]|uniref:hypothetical protein n=1 Tax=Paraburkholderia sediminicola TaxID=458836 RepID=UPI0038B876BD